MATLTINDADKQVLRSAARGENPYARLTRMSESARDRARLEVEASVRKLLAAHVLNADYALTDKGQTTAQAAGVLAPRDLGGEHAPSSSREATAGAAW